MENNNYKLIALSMLIRTRLREFLDRTKDYARFRANLDTHNGRHPAHSVVWYLFSEFERYRFSSESVKNVIPAVINDAFLWCGTPEGHEYWSNLHYAWMEYVRNMPLSKSAIDYFGISTQEE